MEFRRVLRIGGSATVCVIATRTERRCGVSLPMCSAVSAGAEDVLHLSFALADPIVLERLFTRAGFHDIRVEREKREDVVERFDEYWDPIEAGSGLYRRHILRSPKQSAARSVKR